MGDAYFQMKVNLLYKNKAFISYKYGNQTFFFLKYRFIKLNYFFFFLENCNSCNKISFWSYESK